MPIKINPTSEIKARLGLEVDGKIQKAFTNNCAKHMDKYVPMDTGQLADYRIRGTDIIYQQEYAKYQYYGARQDGSRKIVNRNYSLHPLASSYWDRKMVTAEIDQVIAESVKK